MQTLLLQNTLEGGMRVEREKKSCLLLQPVDLDSPSGKGNEGDGRKASSKGRGKEIERKERIKREKIDKEKKEGREREAKGREKREKGRVAKGNFIPHLQQKFCFDKRGRERRRKAGRESQQQKPPCLLPFRDSQLNRVRSKECMVSLLIPFLQGFSSSLLHLSFFTSPTSHAVEGQES